MYNEKSYAEGSAHACGHEYRKHMDGHYGRHGKQFGGFSRIPANISETETGFTIELFSPGFTKEDFSISVAEDILTITAGSKETAEAGSESYTHKEFPVGYFKRSFQLNGKVDTQNISAKYEDGVLKLILPKTPEAQKPAQEIKVG